LFSHIISQQAVYYTQIFTLTAVQHSNVLHCDAFFCTEGLYFWLSYRLNAIQYDIRV